MNGKRVTVGVLAAYLMIGLAPRLVSQQNGAWEGLIEGNVASITVLRSGEYLAVSGGKSLVSEDRGESWERGERSAPASEASSSTRPWMVPFWPEGTLEPRDFIDRMTEARPGRPSPDSRDRSPLLHCPPPTRGFSMPVSSRVG